LRRFKKTLESQILLKPFKASGCIFWAHTCEHLLKSFRILSNGIDSLLSKSGLRKASFAAAVPAAAPASAASASVSEGTNYIDSMRW